VAELADAADLKYPNRDELVSKFLKSRRQGLSPKTIQFYYGYLNRAITVVGVDVTGQNIARFLNTLQCSNGGKHAYFRALQAFYGWLYSRKSGYDLSPQNNPILIVDAPKVEKKILPSLTTEQVDTLINIAHNQRDRCIISLLADSGIRLNELANIKVKDIDWSNYTVTIWGKGNKQRKAPFTGRTDSLLKEWLSSNGHSLNIWGMNDRQIEWMLRNLEKQTGIKCNPHSFRRGFACNLHRKGLSTLDIMHLGGWQDLSMVLRYTRSVTFEDCLEHYRKVSVHNPD
jgi:integrase/recombinase XerC/integrase/recombinase XerD